MTATDTTARIDIHDEIAALCDKLGLEPRNVAEIIFRPSDVAATVYKLNADGSKYIEDDEDGRPRAASETLAFKVTT